MKKALITLNACLLAVSGLLAQKEEEESSGGFRKENLFTGGSITVSFYNRQTVLGANPVFGYKIAGPVDAGIAFNYVYSGTRDYYEFNDRVRQTVYGPGLFTRLYPVSFLFAQAQFEHNYTTLRYRAAPGSVGFSDDKIKTEANSLLLGIGYAEGRRPGANSFYFISLLFDVLKDPNSPYVNVTYNQANPAQQRITMAPIIRAGFNIGLFPPR